MVDKINNYKDLLVWQESRVLVKDVYTLTQYFPKEELYGLTSQVRRSAISVPSNIAEGHTRDSLKDYLRHLSIAIASLAELETQLLLAKDLGYIQNEQHSPCAEQVNKCYRMLRALQRNLKNKLPKPISRQPTTVPLIPHD